jgi:hypothetical protein
VIDWVCCPPGCQVFPKGALLVSVTLSPAQKVVGPPAVITGVGGAMLITTVTGSETADTQFPFTTCTV